jgi:hypothetical protein
MKQLTIEEVIATSASNPDDKVGYYKETVKSQYDNLLDQCKQKNFTHFFVLYFPKPKNKKTIPTIERVAFGRDGLPYNFDAAPTVEEK